MNNITEYQNIIELLKRTLEFYSELANYVQNKPVNNELLSMVEMDNGEQARFALKKIIEFNKNKLDTIGEHIKNAEDALENSDNVDELYETLNQLKKIADENT